MGMEPMLRRLRKGNLLTPFVLFWSISHVFLPSTNPEIEPMHSQMNNLPINPQFYVRQCWDVGQPTKGPLSNCQPLESIG